MTNRSYAIDWQGDKLLGILMEQARTGIDMTNEQAKEFAVADAPVDTGELKEGIDTQAAVIQGSEVVGAFGVHSSVSHAAAVETSHPTKQGFLRRAGDRAYPSLAGRIGLPK